MLVKDDYTKVIVLSLKVNYLSRFFHSIFLPWQKWASGSGVSVRDEAVAQGGDVGGGGAAAAAEDAGRGGGGA